MFLEETKNGEKEECMESLSCENQGNHSYWNASTVY
jgi:hypothetical protein